MTSQTQIKVDTHITVNTRAHNESLALVALKPEKYCMLSELLDMQNFMDRVSVYSILSGKRDLTVYAIDWYLNPFDSQLLYVFQLHIANVDT